MHYKSGIPSVKNSRYNAEGAKKDKMRTKSSKECSNQQPEQRLRQQRMRHCSVIKTIMTLLSICKLPKRFRIRKFPKNGIR